MMDGLQLSDLLHEVNKGVPGAEDRLFKIVYADLRQRARRQLLDAPVAEGTVSPTTLVHETYIRLLGDEGRKRSTWANDKHFYFSVTRAMRDILIEIYRHNTAIKRGGLVKHIALSGELSAPEVHNPIAISEAIDALEKVHSVAASVAKLRVFEGLDHNETARILGIANSTVRRHWKFALGFLSAQLAE